MNSQFLLSFLDSLQGKNRFVFALRTFFFRIKKRVIYLK
uniref:Uncharacterized protein n=1 Tax=Rhizophora mucronata TaxID=61149 RepID=A0A2P2Q785_RHIMU